MSMIFISQYNDKAYLFSDTRVSTVQDDKCYYVHDNAIKAKICGDKIISIMGNLNTNQRLFKVLEENEDQYLSIEAIQKIVKDVYSHKTEELGVYILTVNHRNRFIVYSMDSSDNFEITSLILSNRDYFGAGANSNVALDYIESNLHKSTNLITCIRDAYDYVSDEAVGGQCVIFEIDNKDAYCIEFSRYTSGIRESKELKHFFLQCTPQGKLKLAGKNSSIFIDTEAGKMNLDAMDIEGVGKLDAQYIQTGTITAEDGFINDLTVTALKTLDKSDEIGDSVDYITAKENFIKFSTGTITDRTHAKNNNNELLYWTDANKKQITTNVSTFPVYELEYNPVDKMAIELVGEGMSSHPKITMGAGDGYTYTSGKAVIEKPEGSLDITYHRSNTGAVRAITLDNVGITIRAEANGAVTIEGSNINIVATDKIIFDADEYEFK